MYRFLFRTVCRARSSSLAVCDSSALPTKCDKAAVFRFANGGGIKAISTGSVRLCEKKDGVDVVSNQDEKTNVGVKADPASTLATQKAEDDSTDIKMAEQREETVVLKTEDGNTEQQQMEVKIEQSAEEPKQVKTNATKSGKENLLDLLGSMTVEVTSKRRRKVLNQKQTLISNPATMESTTSMFQKATVEASSQSETLDPELVAAASAAASTLPNPNQAQSELLRQLRQHEAITEAQKKGDVNNLGEIIADMKVGKRPKRRMAWQTNQIRFDDDEQGYTQDRGSGAERETVWRKKTLLKAGTLNIFSPTTQEDAVESAVARPTLWDLDFANQLSTSANQMSRNMLEEMIQWTKEGKMWQYPINNEAGLEEEASVPFHEHIFLEKHLSEGFPRQGPVRHFMELVVAGLSKNPYLTVQQKKEHISWFRDYFHQKEDILKEADVYLK